MKGKSTYTRYCQRYDIEKCLKSNLSIRQVITAMELLEYLNHQQIYIEQILHIINYWEGKN